MQPLSQARPPSLLTAASQPCHQTCSRYPARQAAAEDDGAARLSGADPGQSRRLPWLQVLCNSNHTQLAQQQPLCLSVCVLLLMQLLCLVSLLPVGLAGGPHLLQAE